MLPKHTFGILDPDHRRAPYACIHTVSCLAQGCGLYHGAERIASGCDLQSKKRKHAGKASIARNRVLYTVAGVGAYLVDQCEHFVDAELAQHTGFLRRHLRGKTGGERERWSRDRCNAGDENRPRNRISGDFLVRRRRHFGQDSSGEEGGEKKQLHGLNFIST